MPTLTPEEQKELEALSAQYAPKEMSVTERLMGPDALKEREHMSKDALAAVAGSFMPEGTANPLSWLAKKTGASSIPDRLMQRAVGLKKYIPGMGDNLIEQGVRGTREGMANQVGSKIAEQGAVLDQAVGSIPGSIESGPIAERISQMRNKYSTPGGIVPESVAAEVGKIGDTAKDIASRGAVSPQEALKLKRIAGEVGYKHGEPLAKLTSQMAQQEGSGYGKALESAYEQAMPEGTQNAVAGANNKLSSLLKARKGLNAPEGLGASVLTDAALGGVGYVGGGKEGAAGAIALRHGAKSPLVQSYGAHGLSKLAPILSQAPARLAAGAAGEEEQSRLSPEEQQELDKLAKLYGTQ